MIEPLYVGISPHETPNMMVWGGHHVMLIGALRTPHTQSNLMGLSLSVVRYSTRAVNLRSFASESVRIVDYYGGLEVADNSRTKLHCYFY